MEFIKENAKNIHDAGFSAIWLPPAYKAMGRKNDTGYGVYDMYDLDEFDCEDKKLAIYIMQ